MSAPINTLGDLLAHSLAMELEAVDAYNMLADQMLVHNNKEVAELFRHLAEVEGKHVDEVNSRSSGVQVPHIAPWDYRWDIAGLKTAPEAVSPTETHYLMAPYHAVSLAVRYEQRAVDFYGKVAETATDPEVKKLAQDFCDEEKEHVGWLLTWLQRFPEPKAGWDDDLDPPLVQE